jgi:hypothetical protein
VSPAYHATMRRGLIAATLRPLTPRWSRQRLRTCNGCRFSITIGPVDPATPGVLIVPTIQGGGLELP